MFKQSKNLWIPLIISAMLMACGKEKDEAEQAEKENKVAAIASIDANVVTLTPQLKGFVQLGEVSKQEMRNTLRIPGRIQVDEQYEARLGSPVTGRISQIHVALGQHVSAGQSLASINSSELAQYQLAYIKASQQIQLQSKAVERAKLLLAVDVISVAELQRREAELSAAQAERNAAQDQLMALGMPKATINKLGLSNSGLSTSVVSSKISGTVIERKARVGQVVAPAEDLFVVADLNHLWAVAEIPEQQIALIEKGQAVTIEIPSLENEKVTGKLTFVGDTVNPETRTVIARTEINNDAKKLKPEMLISILLSAQPTMELAVPMAAIIRENNQNFIFVQTQANQVKLKPVSLGHEYAGNVVVTSGLNLGDTIVVDGAFHLNNERKRKEME